MSAESEGVHNVDTYVWTCNHCGKEIDSDHYADITEHVYASCLVLHPEEQPRRRLSWDETWTAVADVIARRSRCDSRQVGAVVVDPTNRPVSTGYNGPPRGLDLPSGSTCTDWCPRRQTGDRGLGYGLSCLSVHAEANALMFADRRDYEGGTIYVTSACCQDCAKLVANSGLKRVVMRVTAEDEHRRPGETIDFLRRCGLEVTTLA